MDQLKDHIVESTNNTLNQLKEPEFKEFGLGTKIEELE